MHRVQIRREITKAARRRETLRNVPRDPIRTDRDSIRQTAITVREAADLTTRAVITGTVFPEEMITVRTVTIVRTATTVREAADLTTRTAITEAASATEVRAAETKAAIGMTETLRVETDLPMVRTVITETAAETASANPVRAAKGLHRKQPPRMQRSIEMRKNAVSVRKKISVTVRTLCMKKRNS